MTFIIFILLGLCSGFLSAFFGIGGGSLIVPMLYILFPSLPPSVVIPASLGTIFIVTASNSLRYRKINLTPSLKGILILALTCSIGGLLGAKISFMLNKEQAKLLIGLLTLLIVCKLFLTKKGTDNKTVPSKPLALGFTGITGGLISGSTGLGGGILFTPMFISLLKLPLKYVAPYSNVAMAFANLMALLPHLFAKDFQATLSPSWLNELFVGNINFGFIGCMSLGAFFSAKFGTRYNESIDSDKKRILLAIILSILALKLLFF